MLIFRGGTKKHLFGCVWVCVQWPLLPPWWNHDTNAVAFMSHCGLEVGQGSKPPLCPLCVCAWMRTCVHDLQEAKIKAARCGQGSSDTKWQYHFCKTNHTIKKKKKKKRHLSLFIHRVDWPYSHYNNLKYKTHPKNTFMFETQNNGRKWRRKQCNK